MTAFGALLIIAAGLLVAWRANRLPVMSARYDSPAAAHEPHAPPQQLPERRSDSATLWESLSRGEDPTAAHPPSVH
jgi:hypothetical protein